MNKRIRKYFEPLYSHAYDSSGFDLPLKITASLYSRWGPGDRFAYTQKALMSVSMITKGSAEFVQEKRRGILRRGEIFLAQKGLSQSFSTGPDGFLHKRSVILDGWALELLMNQTGLSQVDSLRPRRPELIMSYLRRSMKLLREKPRDFTLALSGIAYNLLVELASSLAPHTAPELLRALEYIGRNMSTALNLGSICTAAGVSARQCNRLFHARFKCAPLQFVKRQRMVIAKEMLLNSSLSIKQIALRVGYEDPLYFSHLFRHETGKSPRAFRR